MPWLHFTAPFDFSPAAKGGRMTIAYRAGMVKLVTRECEQAAVAAGKAQRTISPRRSADHARRG
ncbi:hypothetical protein [Kaistia soli]|uniref:hypothetical protein n=1 Tax=Kaistia soli TaxID=446684 RepID=UPI000932C4FA|nr:hypothetical protein [Kaistia soli]